MSDELDPERVAFLRGVLAAFSAMGRVATYDEIRRVCRLNMTQVGSYLGAARRPYTAADQPDFCSHVVGRTKGYPGKSFFDAGATDLGKWAVELRKSQEFWSDRLQVDNDEFVKKWGDVQAFPGGSEDE